MNYYKNHNIFHTFTNKSTIAFEIFDLSPIVTPKYSEQIFKSSCLCGALQYILYYYKRNVKYLWSLLLFTRRVKCY